MWYRFFLVLSIAVFAGIFMLYAVRVVFNIPYSREFEIGSTTGWFLGSFFMIMYIKYITPWASGKAGDKPRKEKVKDESVGVHLDNKEAIKSKAIHLGFKMDGAPLENHSPSIVSIDGNLDSVAIMKNNKDVDTEWTFKDDPILASEVTGNTFMKFGHSDEVLKLPKGQRVTSFKDGVLTIDSDPDGEQPPLHYWKHNEQK